MPTTRNCILCAWIGETRPASMERDDGRPVLRVACTRCGRYLINEDILDDNHTEDSDVGLRLSGLCRERTDAQERRVRPRPDALEITYENIESLAAGAPIPIGHFAYFDRIVELVAQRSKFPGVPMPVASQAVLAALAFLPEEAFTGTVRQMHEEGVLEIFDGDASQMKLRLTVEGWKRAEGLGKGRAGNRAFVAMWFDATMRDAYELGVRPALTRCGYQPPFRIDDAEHEEAVRDGKFTNRIDDRIIAEIRRARFIVADATGARPSVYYEAGFADGLGIPVIWCCRADCVDSMAFDTRQVGHILWQHPADLHEKLVSRIERHGWAIARALDNRERRRR